MTSGNVTNMLVQSLGTVTSELSTKKPEPIVPDKSFDQVLQNAGNTSVEQAKKTELKQERGTEMTEKISDKKFNEKSLVKENEAEEVDDSKLVEKIEEFVKEVTEVIKDELDVTDEELEEAMEVLGLTAIDLIDPQNLVKLVLELDNEVDSITLLMSDEFKSVFDDVSKLVNQLLEEIDVSPVEVKDIMISFKETVVEESKLIAEDSIKEDFVEEDAPIEIQPTIVKEQKDTSPVKEEAEVVEDEGSLPVVTKETVSADNSNEQNNDSNFDTSKQEVFQSKKEETVIKTDSVFNTVAGFERLEYSPVEETVTLPDGQQVNVSEMIDQIVEQAKVLNNAESTTMEMTLNPEGLGKIFMEVTQKGDEITAKLFTENEVVKEALENQMATLRNQLNEGSTKVTSIEVAVGAHEFERNLEEDSRQQQNAEEQARQGQTKRSRIDLNSLDELSSLMTEEEQLVAQIMRENGNTLNYQA